MSAPSAAKAARPTSSSKLPCLKKSAPKADKAKQHGPP
jgi:hypothetical protein